MPDHMELQT